MEPVAPGSCRPEASETVPQLDWAAGWRVSIRGGRWREGERGRLCSAAGIPPIRSASSRSATQRLSHVRECSALDLFGGSGVDPVTLGTVLLAVVTGVSEALSGQLWAEVVSLIRRPLRHKTISSGDAAAVPSGEAELVALQQALGDEQKALALAEVLLARADADDSFMQALVSWWEQAEPVRARIGNVSNAISGGTQHGPVLQGRDVSNVHFGEPWSPEHKGLSGDARGD